MQGLALQQQAGGKKRKTPWQKKKDALATKKTLTLGPLVFGFWCLALGPLVFGFGFLVSGFRILIKTELWEVERFRNL